MAARRKRSLAERKQSWSRVVDNSYLILEDMPHMQGEIGELKELHKEILALSAKQARMVAKLRELTLKIRVLSKKADNLRGRIGASIRGQYGFSHMRLMQLGFRPHRGGIKLERELADLAAREETIPKGAPPSEEE
jgi:hypothetical protein